MKDIPYVKGSALTIFSIINNYPNYSFLHPYFRKICKDLPQFPNFDLVYILILLHRYSRIFLSDRNVKNADLELLLSACDKLLRSMHAEVVIEVGNIFLEFPSDDRINNVIFFPIFLENFPIFFSKIFWKIFFFYFV